MGISYYSVLAYGVELGHKRIQKTVTKYNENTGMAYNKTINTTVSVYAGTDIEWSFEDEVHDALANAEQLFWTEGPGYLGVKISGGYCDDEDVAELDLSLDALKNVMLEFNEVARKAAGDDQDLYVMLQKNAKFMHLNMAH